jgi:PAS domain S-box-containing protein
MINALVVDDEAALLDIAKVFIEESGEIQVDSATSAAEALDKLAQGRYDVIVSDYQMPDINGIDFLQRLKAAGSSIPFILFTGKGREDVAIEALNTGADFYLQKGGDPNTQFAELINLMRRSVEQKRAMETARDTEEIYEKLFKENKAAMFLADPVTGVIADANQAAVDFFGYTPEEILAKSMEELAPSDVTDLKDMVMSQVEKGSTFATRAMLKSGKVRDVDVYCGMIRVHGNNLGYAILHDVTQRNQAENGLRRLNRALRVVSEADQLMIRAEKESTLLKGICQTMVETGGYSFAWVGMAEDSTEKRVIPVAYAGDGEEYLSQIRLTWDESKTGMGPTGTAIRTGEVTIAHNTGSDENYKIWANLAAAHNYHSSIAIPIRSGGRVSGALNAYSAEDRFDDLELQLLTDLGTNLSHALSALKTTEEKVAETAGKMRAIIQTSPLAIMSIDPDGDLATWNPAADRIFGWTEEDLARPLPFLNEEEPGNEEIAVKIVAGIALSDVEIKRKDREGKEHFISLSTAPLVDANGHILSIMAVASDITERRQMQSRLVELNEMLRLINGILRHDTLNELTVLSGSLEMYQMTKQDKFLASANKSVARSVDLIRGMKELESFAMAGGALRPYSLRDVAERVFRNYAIEHSVNGDASVMADEALASIIDNIIRNAITHGKANIISVDICDENGGCMLTIADNGTGIPDDVKRRIFDEGFSHGPTAGSGLGLYLVKKAMGRYGGTVLAEDNAPQGTVFVMRFPGSLPT